MSNQVIYVTYHSRTGDCLSWGTMDEELLPVQRLAHPEREIVVAGDAGVADQLRLHGVHNFFVNLQGELCLKGSDEYVDLINDRKLLPLVENPMKETNEKLDKVISLLETLADRMKTLVGE